MANILMPEVVPSLSDWELVDNSEVYSSPLTGATQTNSRGGERWRCTLSFTNLRETDRRVMQAFLSELKGRENRAVMRDHAYTPSGSIATTNLNPSLVSSNWIAQVWQQITNLLSGIRVRRQGNTTNGSATSTVSSVSGEAGKSYTHKVAISSPNSLLARGRKHFIGTGTGGNIFDDGNSDHTTQVSTKGFTLPANPLQATVTDNLTTGAGYSQFDLHLNEVARGFLVDNGVNELARSQRLDETAWTKTRSSVTSNTTTAPDGSSTADELVEDSSAGSTHLAFQTVTRSSVQEYWTGSVYVKANTNSRIRLNVSATDGSSSDSGNAFFSSSTGTITSSASANGSAENAYASIRDAGNGWYRCQVSVRLPASTSACLLVFLADGDSNTLTFNGDGTSGVYVWGAQLQQGGQLGRYAETDGASAATPDTQTGSEVWLKGLDANTTGQLIAGDLIEINGQLLRLTSDLDGDESGVGLATVTPRIRIAPADEDACVIYRPRGKFLLESQSSGWSNTPGGFSNITLTFIEDIS